MKVCTDACLFGAWVTRGVPGRKKVLDIGTGTGLLSLMYAQQNLDAVIDAVEIDRAAAEQAQENFDNSPWSDRLMLHPGTIQEFTPDIKYDLILSNPPFFENDLRSPDPERNKAMHDTSLTLEELGEAISRLLAPGGIVALLLPYHRSDYCITIMNKCGLRLIPQVRVKQTPVHGFFRSILCFSQEVAVEVPDKEEEQTAGLKPDGDQRTRLDQQEIIIKTADNVYSEAFTALLKDYYLYL